MDHCQICSSENSSLLAKYKCPNCLIKYCSIACWNKHKEYGCSKVDIDSCEDEEKSRINTVLLPTEDTVDPKLLEQLKFSEKLKILLKDPILRKIIKEVDGAENVKVMMEKVMKDSIFTEFVDVCINIVEPVDEDNHKIN